MRLKNYAYRCLAVVCAIVAVACVDENFSFDKVSTEVSVINEKTVLPLGSFKRQTLGDMLKQVEMDALTKNEDGSYEFIYEMPDTTFSAGEDFELPTSFTIERISQSFDVELPQLDFSSYAVDFTEGFNLNTDLGFLSDLLQGKDQVEITSTMLGIIPEDQRKIGATVNGNVDIADIELALPKQIKNINKIHFADGETGHHGAPFHVTLDLNGLAGVNAGGFLNFMLHPSGTDLLIYDANDKEVKRNEDGDYCIELEIDPGDKVVDFAIYIESIVNTNEPVEGVVSIDPSMSFDVEFELNAGEGILTASVPTVTVSSHFELYDAEVVFDSSVDLVNFELSGDNGFEIPISNLPEQIESINTIALSDDSVLSLFASGLDWLGDNVSIDLTLPNCIDISDEGEGYSYDAETGLLSTTTGAISKGLNIVFEAIDFGPDGLKAEDGVSIKFEPAVSVHFTDETPISITEFIPEGKVNVAVGLEESKLGFESVSAKVNFDYGIDSGDKPIELGDLSTGGFSIDGIGISPVIELSLSNPLTVGTTISASIIPIVDGAEADAINIEASIKGAEYDKATGKVIPATTILVLAKPDRAAEFPESEGYTFVACDIEKIFTDPLPSALAYEATLSLPDELITLYMVDELSLTAGVKFSLPVAFDDKLSLGYEDTISILNEDGSSPFAGLVDIESLKIGDVALIMEVATTLPLELEATTTLLDAEDNELPTKIGFFDENNKITGSKDGVTESVSVLRMAIDLAGDGSLAQLEDIAKVALSLGVKSTSEGVVSLKDDQYVSANLKLEIDGGVTVDIDDLL